MKNTYLLLLTSIALVSCGNSISKKDTRGIIDCYSISVKNGGLTVFSENYSISYVSVFEYKDDSGKCIYVSSRVGQAYYDYQTGKETFTDLPIEVYKNRYEDKHVSYNFSRFVGYLSCENNYLLDLDARIIDSEIKFSQYLKSDNPNNQDVINNKEAYEKAKKGFYTGYYNEIHTDMIESGMERHSYTKLGDDCVISYKAKWY